MPDWYKNKFFIPLFIFLISISIVLGISPFETQVSLGSDIIEVEVPAVEIIKQGQQGVTLHTHIFNKSNGIPFIPSSSSIGCYLHLYNYTGKHLLQEELTADSNGLEWKLDIGANNFSVIGAYSYLLWCNDSNTGGFVRGGFEVTETGLAEPTQDTEEELLLYFVFVLCIILLFVAFYKNDQNLASISGMLMIVLGGYIIVAGFSTLSNGLSDAIGIILIAVGFYILLRSNIENF